MKNSRRHYPVEQVEQDYQTGERNFRGIVLTGRSAKGKDLSGADFTGATFKCKNFKAANLAGANFSKAKLHDINFGDANLQGATFVETDIKKTTFCNTNLNHCIFNSSKLRRVDFSKANMKQTTFAGARFISDGWITSILCVFSALLYFAGFTVALITTVFFCDLFEGYQGQIFESNPFQLILCHAILLFSLIYFYTISVGKVFIQRFVGFLYGILIVFLFMLNQPIITVASVIMMLIWLYKIYQDWKTCQYPSFKPFSAVMALLTIIWVFFVLYKYEFLINLWIDDYDYLADGGFIFIDTILVVILSLLWSIRVSTFTTEIIFLIQPRYQKKSWKSIIQLFCIYLPYVAILLSFFLLVTFLLFVSDFNLKDGINRDEFIFFEYFFIACLANLSGFYYGFKAAKDNDDFQCLRNHAVCFCHGGGIKWPIVGSLSTTFNGANLTQANFSDTSTLKNADFTGAILHGINWNNAYDLKRARVGNSYLSYPKIRCLLSSCFDTKKPSLDEHKTFENLDLQGISLKNLSNKEYFKSSSFRDSNLSEADLSDLDLTNVNLSGCNLNHTNLRHTHLTGIRIQNWQIDNQTDFTGVTCEYVYLNADHSKDNLKAEIGSEHDEGNDSLGKQLLSQLISQEDFQKIQTIREEFHKISLIQNHVQQEYKLQLFSNQAERQYGIEPERYCDMFKAYQREIWMAKRKQSWWQSFLWFKVEPWIEKANHWTQELDIFPLLENLGRLSILIGVITFFNNVLKPNTNVEILEEAKISINRFNLEQLRTSQDGLVGLDTSQVRTAPSKTLDNEQNSLETETQLDLSGIDLSGANLTDANFHKVNLSKAKFTGATLIRSDFSHADLTNSIFSNSNNNIRDKKDSDNHVLDQFSFLIPRVFQRRTNLQDSNFSAATLKSVNFSDTDIRRSNLSDANLRNANLSDADLRQSNLHDADLRNADLRNANLRNADLRKTDLHDADLRNANLRNADLRNANLNVAVLSKTNFNSANLIDTDLRNIYTDSRNTDLSDPKFFRDAFYTKDTQFPENFNPQEVKMTLIEPEVNLRGRDLKGLDFTDINLRGADLRGADLRGTNLSGADLRGTNLSGADLSEANLSSTDFRGAFYTKNTQFSENVDPKTAKMIEIGPNANLSGLKLSNFDFSGLDLTNTDFSDADLSGADLWNTDLSGADLSGADLSGADLWDANLDGIQWNKTTIWPDQENVATARNIPERLKEELGITP